MAENKIAAAIGSAGLNGRRNPLAAREMDLAVREAILQAASDGIQDPEIIRHRMMTARRQAKEKHR